MDREERLQQIRDIVAQYAKAKADRVYLHEFRKSKRSMLMKKYETEGHKTAAAQEREATADPDYVAVLDGLREAVEAEEKLRYELVLQEQQFEEWKTKVYQKTAEMKAYGH